MSTTIKFPVLISALFAVLFLTACSDKVDKTLDRVEDVVSKYEMKAKNTALTNEDIKDMRKQLDDINEDYRINVGKQNSQWEENQRERNARLIARREKLEQSVPRLSLPY